MCYLGNISNVKGLSEKFYVYMNIYSFMMIFLSVQTLSSGPNRKSVLPLCMFLETVFLNLTYARDVSHAKSSFYKCADSSLGEGWSHVLDKVPQDSCSCAMHPFSRPLTT